MSWFDPSQSFRFIYPRVSELKTEVWTRLVGLLLIGTTSRGIVRHNPKVIQILWMEYTLHQKLYDWLQTLLSQVQQRSSGIFNWFCLCINKLRFNLLRCICFYIPTIPSRTWKLLFFIHNLINKKTFHGFFTCYLLVMLFMASINRAQSIKSDHAHTQLESNHGLLSILEKCVMQSPCNEIKVLFWSERVACASGAN